MSDVKTVCPRDCYDTCFMTVSIRDGELVRTMRDKDNPVTEGVLCLRGYRDHNVIINSTILMHNITFIEIDEKAIMKEANKRATKSCRESKKTEIHQNRVLNTSENTILTFLLYFLRRTK